MPRERYFHGNAFADAKAAIEELLWLHRVSRWDYSMIHFLKALLIQEDKQKQHLKRDKHTLLECQTQSNPGGTPPRANINVATHSVQPPIALFSDETVVRV